MSEPHAAPASMTDASGLHDGTKDELPASGGSTGRAVVKALDQLRDMILTRRLQPGEQVRQEEMSRVLATSRVSLREALLVLASEGLLTHRPHQGYFVSKISREYMEQVYALLEFLETELMRTLRWPTEPEIAELRALNAAMVTADATRDLSALNRLNREFHSTIFRLSPLELFLSECERFWTVSEPYQRVHIAAAGGSLAILQHEQLVDALGAQDRSLCLRVMTQHRRDSYDAIFAVLRMAGSDGPR